MQIQIQRIFIYILLISLAWGCKAKKPLTSSTNTSGQESASPSLLTFDKGTVSKAEFERVYAKNNGGLEEASKHTTAQLREYLDLYINFKRKVFEAESMGLDTTPAFNQEFETYRKQLVQPYLSAKEVEEQLIKEAYERSKMSVDASHLLIGVEQDASPEDTLVAYQKIMAIRDSIANGQKEFEEMTVKYSTDPSAKQNKGRLGYFNVFEMVYPFETAAFTTDKGNVSMPIRTRFGYHLINVHDKQSIEGKKHVSHIIIRVGDRYSAKTEEEAQAKIQEIYEKLKAGEDFATLASQFSDDPSSSGKGGDLGTGRLLAEMENAKYTLDEGEFSEPFTTRFGHHILKVTKVDKLPPFEEAQIELKQKISRDSRSQLGRQALIQRIKNENGFKLDDASFALFKEGLDENFPRGNWQPDTAQEVMYENTLFTLDNGNYKVSIQDFIDYYQKSRIRKSGMTPAQAAESMKTSYVEQKLLEYEEAQLPKKNPEFRHLVQEYRDGILLFTLMERKVWKKAVEDTMGLQNYYQAHQDSFHKDQTIDVREFRTTERAPIDEAKKMLAQGMSEAQIDSVLNQTSSLTLRIISQTYEKGDPELPAEIFEKEVGYQSDILGENNFFRLLVVQEKHPAGIPPLEKVKSEAITRYQDYLEQQWLKELAEKYPVEIDEDVFASLFK